MGFDFNMDEILAMAEEIERNGASFYRTAAGEAPDPETRQLLEELAAMEDEHEKIFAGLRAALTAEDKQPGAFDPDDDTARYLKSLADLRVFHNKAIDINSMESVLEEAILTEKDSISFYVGMRAYVPRALGKEKVDKVIKEEMGHLTLLTDKLKEIKGR